MSGAVAQIARNALTGWASTLLRHALSVVVVPLLLRHLGKEAYGLTGVAMSVVGITAVADFGLRRGLTRNLAEHVATKDDAGLSRLASSAMAIYLALGGALAAGVWALAPWLADAFHVAGAHRADAIFILRAFGAPAVLLTFVVQVYLGVLSSHERFDHVNYANSGLGLAASALMIASVLWTDTGLRGWALANTVARVGQLVYVLVAAHRVSPGLRVRPWRIDRAALVPVFALGGWLFVAQAENVLMQNSDTFILGALLGASAVAAYRPAMSLVAVARPLVNVLALQLSPRATAYHVTGDPERLRELLVRGTKYTFLMGVASSTVLFALAEPILRVWLGDALGDDLGTTATLLRLWAAIDLVAYAGGTQWSVLVATLRVRGPVLLYLPLALGNVTANALMVKYGPWGIAGVLVPTLAFELIARALITRYTAHVVELPLREYLRRAHAPGLRVLAVMAPAAAALSAFVSVDSLPVLLGAAAVLALVWAAAAWAVGFDAADRAAARHLLGRLRGAR